MPFYVRVYRAFVDLPIARSGLTSVRDWSTICQWGGLILPYLVKCFEGSCRPQQLAGKALL